MGDSTSLRAHCQCRAIPDRMPLTITRDLLQWLGRHARFALPASVFVGLALPSLASALRPVLTLAVIGTLTSVVIRLDWRRLVKTARSPALPAALTVWQLLACPILLWWSLDLLGLPASLALVVVLQAAAPPIGSLAAFAMFIGLDATLAMIGTVLTTLALPLTLTFILAWILPEAGIQLDIWEFFAWVSIVVAAPFAVAAIVRQVVGVETLNRNDDLLAGINVVLLAVFAIAVMDGVTAAFLAKPAVIGKLLALALVSTFVLHALGFALFHRAGTEVAYTAALLSGNRNMGLMLVVTAGTAGEWFSLYVGVAQIPMYFMPMLLAPLLQRSLRADKPSPNLTERTDE